jgi:DNA-directed RNA polymerase subunit RPC12/RpoP
MHLRCRSCSNLFTAEKPGMACPRCGSQDTVEAEVTEPVAHQIKPLTRRRKRRTAPPGIWWQFLFIQAPTLL